MAKVLAVVNQKGGVGKSVTTRNLGEALGLQGKKVLLLDFDPQGSLSIASGLDAENLDFTICNLLEQAMEDMPLIHLEDSIYRLGNVDIIPANIELASLEATLVNAMSREQMLKSVIDEVEGDYDYVLIDCSPSLGMLTINALTAADSVIIPVTPQYLSARGLELLLKSIVRVKRRLNRALQIEGVLMTMYDKRMKLTREIEDIILEAYQEEISIFGIRIPTSVKMGEAILNQQSILQYAPKNPVSEAYKQLAMEVIK
nr:ParA family protein [uncultured Niameybacter sp.]